MECAVAKWVYSFFRIFAINVYYWMHVVKWMVRARPNDHHRHVFMMSKQNALDIMSQSLKQIRYEINFVDTSHFNFSLLHNTVSSAFFLVNAMMIMLLFFFCVRFIHFGWVSRRRNKRWSFISVSCCFIHSDLQLHSSKSFELKRAKTDGEKKWWSSMLASTQHNTKTNWRMICAKAILCMVWIALCMQAKIWIGCAAMNTANKPAEWQIKEGETSAETTLWWQQQ